MTPVTVSLIFLGMIVVYHVLNECVLTNVQVNPVAVNAVDVFTENKRNVVYLKWVDQN